MWQIPSTGWIWVLHTIWYITYCLISKNKDAISWKWFLTLICSYLADIVIYLKITKKGDSKNSEMDTPEERLRRRKEPLSSCTRSVTSHPVPPSCSQSSLLKHEERSSPLDKKKKKKFIFKPLTLLLSAHFFSLSSSPWQTLNCLWKVLGTTFPRIWKKYQQCPLSSRLQSYTAGWQEYWYKCLEEQFGNILARALDLCISFGPISHLLES